MKNMKIVLLALFLLIAGTQITNAQAKLPSTATGTPLSKEEQEILELSKNKWNWMSEKNVESLNTLFKDNAVFVHMGGSWDKKRELDIIKGGFIWYKKAEVYGASVNIFGNTAILLNDIDLVAVVGGRDAINPFMVTEVYIKEDGKWKMGSLTFSHLSRPLKLGAGKAEPKTQE